MMKSVGILILFCALFLGGCERGDQQTDNSEHLLKEHKRALDKAKDVERLTREAAERQRQAVE